MTSPIKIYRPQSQQDRLSITRPTILPPTEGEIGLSVANLRAEKAVLGAILAMPEALSAVRDLLRTEDFYSKFNAGVYDICCQVDDAGQGVDLQTVGDRVYQRFYAKPGVPADDAQRAVVDNLLIECMALAPVPEHASTYAQMVRQSAQALRVLAAIDAIKTAVVTEGVRGDALAERCNAVMFEATEQYSAQDITAQQMASDYLDAMEVRLNSPTPVGIPSGWKELDAIIGGFTPGEITVWGGSAGMGKTTVLMSLARSFALYEQVPTVLFSCEMSREEILHKMIAMEVGLSPAKLKLGTLNTSDQMGRLVEGVGIVSRYTWRVYDEFQPLRPALMRNKLRSLLRREKVSQVIVDGLWLMKGDLSVKGEEQYRGERTTEVTDILTALTKMAKDFGVHIHVIQQYKRGINWRSDHKRVPQLDDFAEAAAVERTAQNIIGIYTGWYIAVREGQIPEHYNANLYVLKTRIGELPGRKADIYYDRNMWGYPVTKDGKAVRDERNPVF